MTEHRPFSRRLDFEVGDNPLAAAERAWRQAGRPLLDLTVSNPTAVALAPAGQAEAQAQALAQALADPAVAGYAPEPLGPRSARLAVAGEYARLGAPVDPGHLALTASSSESYALLFKLLCDPGDRVLVPAPSYPLFDFLARLEGVQLGRYRLAHGFGRDWHIDWSSFDPGGARAVVVVNPNNPTGSFLTRADHQRLVQICAERQMALIADEVFADYARAPGPQALITVAAEPSPPALSFALGGLSKSCGLPQLKLGWIAALGPEALVAAALARLELIADTYLSVGTPVLAGLPRLLALGAQRRAEIQARLQQNLHTLAALIDRDQPVSALPSEGGWSAILRLPAQHSDEAWALSLLSEDGVLVQPGYFFDLEGLGATVVLSLLTPPADLAEGLARLLRRVAALSS